MLKPQPSSVPQPVVQIRNLKKEYAGRLVLDGVSFEVHQGEIFGFLGANGAGKTTTLEILEGLRAPTSGSVRLFGMDVHKNLNAIRERIGVSLQSTRYWDLLTVRETIELFRSLYRKPMALDDLVESFGLIECIDKQMRLLSGGNYQRVALALALVNDPELVLLDEPTTGLDPNARRQLWILVRDLKARGRTVILTTHYMEEARALCQRIAIINSGKIVECGTPDELIEALPAEIVICFSAAERIDLSHFGHMEWCHDIREAEPGKYLAYCNDLPSGLNGLMEWAVTTRTFINSIETRGPTLDDVFIRNARKMEGVMS